MRTRHLDQWTKPDERILAIRRFSRRKDKTYKTYEIYKTYFLLERNDPELFSNLLISQIRQTNFLLDRQLKSLAKRFSEKGGLWERMYRVRSDGRAAQRAKALALLREVYRKRANMGLI